jgi:hypothetical protein
MYIYEFLCQKTLQGRESFFLLDITLYQNHTFSWYECARLYEGRLLRNTTEKKLGRPDQRDRTVQSFVSMGDKRTRSCREKVHQAIARHRCSRSSRKRMGKSSHPLFLLLVASSNGKFKEKLVTLTCMQITPKVSQYQPLEIPTFRHQLILGTFTFTLDLSLHPSQHIISALRPTHYNSSAHIAHCYI